MLHDFVGTAWRGTTDPAMSTAWGTISPSSTTVELNGLVIAARDERPPAMGEILSQDAEFITDFMGLLTITPGSHPNTYRVLHAASLIGSYAVLYYKGLRGGRDHRSCVRRCGRRSLCRGTRRGLAVMQHRPG